MQPQSEPNIPALQEPVIIKFCAMAKDGGTISVVLTDAAEQQLALYFDKRMGGLTPGRLYVGGYPTDANAQVAPLGGEVETIVLRLFHDFIEQHPGIKSRYVTETEHHIALLSQAITTLEELSNAPNPQTDTRRFGRH